MRALVCLALAACAAAPHTREAGAVASLAVRPVTWNAANAPVGKVSAVAEAGEVAVVFADDGAAVFSGKALVARDARAKGWSSAAAIWSTDGASTWLVGIDPAGRVQRLAGMSAFEDVSPRYGLAGRKVKDAANVGPGRVGFLLDGQLALGGDAKLAIYPAKASAALSGGGDFAACVGQGQVELVNGTNALVTRYALPGVNAAAVDDAGRLYASTDRAVYAGDAAGGLALVFDAGHDGVHDLVAGGGRVWFADRGELGVVDGVRVRETSGLGLASPRLTSAANGDVWVIDGGKLARYEVPGARAAAWATAVAPVFARACATCHLANGKSGVDLSTEAAWEGKRGAIRERVLVSRTMPPRGHTLTEEDRRALADWLGK